MSRQDKLIRREQRQVQIVAARKQWSAPLPPPEALERFNQIVPGSAERIISMAEGHAADGWATNRAVRQIATTGQIFAFIIAMTGLIGGLWLIAYDKSPQGLTALIGALAVPLLAFLTGRSPRKPS